MTLIIALIILEVLTIMVLKDHFSHLSRKWFYLSLSVHILISIMLWYVIVASITFKGYFDSPSNISMHLNMSGMIVAAGITRFILSFFHYTGKLIRFRKRGHIRGLTNAGIGTAGVILLIIFLGTIRGKYNVKTENVTVMVKGMDKGLNGLKIVQISDLHLGGFYNHTSMMLKVVETINSFNPDLVFNTGDFVSYGWREFNGFDTILLKTSSHYGKYAILGNHDMGTYYPGSSSGDRKAIARKVDDLAEASGYTVLNDENVILDINGSEVALIGVETYGRHPDIIHGDLTKASVGTDSADLKILLAHDPNQWEEDVTGKTDIDLTLSGHTHGMQIGIITKRFRWSPSKYFYPNWGGLYRNGKQVLYVNRGLGVMGVPFRIWMPPEITVITLVCD